MIGGRLWWVAVVDGSAVVDGCGEKAVVDDCG